MKRLLLILCLIMLAGICLAQVLNPPAWISFTRTGDTTGEIRWAVDPTGWADYYYFGLYPTTDKKFPPAYCDPAWNVPGDWAAAYTLETPANYMRVINSGIVAGTDYDVYVAAVRTTTGWNWAAFSSWESVPPTLPVELSYFAASLTAQNYVKLSWVSQSETGLLGYRVYRGESDNQANACNITPVLVPATNTSTTHNYSLTDEEVVIGSTYYYWLESVDMGSSDFFGPTSVLVEGEVPPVLPELTTMRNAYPNPFVATSGTTIEVSMKAGEAGSLTIYNISGQIVQTFRVYEGQNPLVWNGRDSRGNICGSGIYFYKLSSPSLNQTRKMAIIK
jgi:hypothetical protein